MKKGHTVRKRPLALFMHTQRCGTDTSACTCPARLPEPSSELTKAEIIYTVNPVKKETGSNIIFLVDASKAAYSTTVKNLVSAMQTNFRGANLLDAYDMPN